MTESSTADAPLYAHTLTHNPYTPPPPYNPPPLLTTITAHLLSLPPEIRSLIYHFTFTGNRVAVTSLSGCFCANPRSASSGKYRFDDHRWLLSLPKGSKVRRDAQRGFVREAVWEIHCPGAEKVFNEVMGRLGLLGEVRKVRCCVFETSVESWVVGTEKWVGLRECTFVSWQKGWTVVVPEGEGVGDGEVVERVKGVVGRKEGWGFVRRCLEKGRWERGGWRLKVVFPIRFMVGEVGRRRWCLRVWRADLEGATVERGWREVHLVQEGTLD